MRAKATTDDLLDALRAALTSAVTDGTTAPELMAATGCGEKPVHRALKMLLADGRLEVVRVQRTNMVGVTQPVPAYRIKAA